MKDNGAHLADTDSQVDYQCPDLTVFVRGNKPLHPLNTVLSPYIMSIFPVNEHFLGANIHTCLLC